MVWEYLRNKKYWYRNVSHENTLALIVLIWISNRLKCHGHESIDKQLSNV